MTAIPHHEELPNRRDILAFTGGLAATTLAPSSTRNVLAARTRRYITGWMSHHGWGEGFQSAIEHADHIETLSPGWYDLRAEGEIVTNPEARVDNPQVRSFADSQGIALHPLVMNVTATRTQPELVRTLFADKAARLSHHQQLRTLAERYSGIVLDYEGLRLPDMPYFAEFVEEVSYVLRSVRKSFGVTLEALPGDAILTYWKRIAAATDSVYLMAYGQKPKDPGPFIRPPWFEDVVRRAAQAIPSQKLVLGLAVYGLSWGPKGVSSGTWRQYTDRAERSNIPAKIDGRTGMLWYTAGNEQAWVENATSIEMKMRLAIGIGVRRFAFWRLGGEDPQIWQVVRALA